MQALFGQQPVQMSDSRFFRLSGLFGFSGLFGLFGFFGFFGPSEIGFASHGINLFGPGEIAENWAFHGINLFHN